MTRTSAPWLAGLALTGVAALAFAQAPPATTDSATTAHEHGQMHGHHGMHGHFMHVLHELNLTADQKTQVHSIMDAAHPQMEALHNGSRDTMSSLIAIAPTDPGYPALIEKAKANALAHVQLMSDLYTQIYAVLTPEQRAKIPGIAASHKAKWQGHHSESASHEM